MQFKKMVSILLAATMMSSLLTGCGSDASEKTEQGEVSTEVSSEKDNVVADSTSEEAVIPEELTYPVDTDVTLKVYVNGILNLSSGYTDYDDVPFTQGLEKNTGIDVEWETYTTGSDMKTSYNLLLQQDELPDIIIGDVASPAHITELLEDGVLQDISEYLPLYAPDYWEFINSEGQTKNLKMIQQDGRVVNFIGVRETPKWSTYLGWGLRQDWLDALGLEVPTTIEEFEDVAVAFHENYGALIGVESDRLDYFLGSSTGAQAGMGLRYYLDGDKVLCANDQEEWKDYLTLVKRWYDMGILDPNFSSSDANVLRAYALEGKMGLGFTRSSQFLQYLADAESEETGAEWIGISNPVAQEGDPIHFIQTEYATWNGVHGAYVTKDCTEEELIAALQFLNYGYTEEGCVYWTFGEEGVSFEYDEEGNPRYTELITKDERGINQALYDYTGAYAMPLSILLDSITAAQPNGGAKDQMTSAWVSGSDATDYYLPTLSYTAEEQATKTDIDAALKTYVKESALKFVTGEKSLDEFDSFVEDLYKIGLQESLDITNAAYQRYISE